MAVGRLARFADTKRLRYPDRGLCIPNEMERPRRALPQGSGQVLGSNPRPRIAVRGHPWLLPRMESRMRGNSHVRFGAGEKPAPETGQGASSLLYRSSAQRSRSPEGRLRCRAAPVSGLSRPSEITSARSPAVRSFTSGQSRVALRLFMKQARQGAKRLGAETPPGRLGSRAPGAAKAAGAKPSHRAVIERFDSSPLQGASTYDIQDDTTCERRRRRREPVKSRQYVQQHH